MRMVNFRTPYNAGRLALALAVVLLLGFFLLPNQLQGVFQEIGSPIGWVLSWPLRAVAGIQGGAADFWGSFVALQGVQEENAVLRKELEQLKGQNSQLREAAAATQRRSAQQRERPTGAG